MMDFALEMMDSVFKTDEFCIQNAGVTDSRAGVWCTAGQFQWKNPDFLLRNPDFLF